MSDATLPAIAMGAWRMRWRLAWQAAVSGLFAAVAVFTVDLGALRDALAHASLWWAAPALLLFTAAKYVDSWRWRYLLRGVGPPPQRALFGAFLIGNMVNNLLPLRAGDVAKIQVLGLRHGVSRAALAASVFVVEAVLDGVVFVLFLLAALAFTDLGALPSTGIAALVLLAATAFAAAVALSRAGVARALALIPRRWRGAAASALRDAGDGLYALRAWRRTLGAIALSVPAWLLEAGMFALFGRAFDLGLTYPQFVAVMIAANLAVALPVALWNFGPYEALVVGVLVAAGGIDESLALSYAVAVHVLTSLWISATGLLAFWALGVRPRELFSLRGSLSGGAASTTGRTPHR